MIQRGKMTTLLVTHDLSDAIQLVDRLFFLSARPARIVAEVPLPPPRGMRSKQTIDRISDELKAMPFMQTAT